MKSLNVFPASLLLCFVFTAALLRGQSPTSYLNDIGSTAYGVNIPVENGFINVSNGNLHLEFPVSSHPQRGALSLSEKLTYDSRIWNFSSFGTKGSYHWWPYNVPGTSTSSGGWQFVSGAEIGSVAYGALSQTSTRCQGPDDGDDPDPDPGRPTPYSGLYIVRSHSSITWTDPSGSIHPFNASLNSLNNECDSTLNTSSLTGGFATDGSGFQIPSDAGGNIRIIDASGTQMYPNVADRYGNEWLLDSSGNLVDDTGLTPVIATQNGLTTYYDVLAPNGPINNNGTRVRYTVTNAPVNVSTQFLDFSQSDIHSWVSSNDLKPVQSIVLPDGSQYSFTYDINGELATMTLPTGGVVRYGYTDYVDSANTENNWLTSRQQGGGALESFRPFVGSSCTNYGPGCTEFVIHHRPSGDETLYQLTLINGAWNTDTGVYTGAVPFLTGKPTAHPPANNRLSYTTNTYQYSNACSGPNCVGANYITSSLATTILSANGAPSIFTQSLSTFDPNTGKPLSTKEWDYSSNLSSLNYSVPPASTPARDTEYTYTGLDPNTVTVFDNNGRVAGQTTYGYTTSAAPAGPFPGWSSTNAGGPYLQSVSHWVNTSSNPSTTTYTMDSTGMVTSVVDANQNPASSIQYQCNNSLPSISSNALQQSTMYGYDCNSGAPTSAKDPNGAMTTYTYEAVAGRPSTTTLPDGGTTTYSYPSVTETDVSVSASPSPSINSSTLYDAYGRTIASLSGGIEIDSTYDSNGRRLCGSLPYSQGTSSSGSSCVTSYDGLDRPLTLQQSDASTRTWSYSANMVSTTDEVGNTSMRSSDAFGHLRSVVEPGPSGPLSTAYVYDGLGNIQTVTQSGLAGSDTPRTRTFTYDSMSRLVCEAHPESSSGACPQNAMASMPSTAILYSYDAGGRVQTKTDARGVVTTYTYDALNRLTFKRYSDGTQLASFGYDGFAENGTTRIWQATNAIGRLSTMSNEKDNATLFGYDLMGRISSQTFAIPSDTSFTLTATSSYDLAGNLIRLTYPDGRQVTQAWDSAGRLSTVGDGTNSQAYLQSMAYYANGSPGAMTLGNGIVQSWGQNNRLQVSGVSVSDGITGANYLSHTYCYVNCPSGGTANNGNLWQITDNLGAARTQAFTYDNLNRISSFSLGGILKQQYAIDSFGNLSGVSGGQPNHTFDPATNRISNLPCAASVQPYDAAGNQLCDTDQNNGVSLYSFDAENRIAQVNTLGNAATPFVSFTYGADGGRVRKFLNPNNTFTEYVNFNGQTIAEKDQTGAWTDYVYANGKRIATVATTENVLQVAGSYSGGWTGVGSTIAAPALQNYTFQPGDVLNVRQRKFGANVHGGILIFGNGAGSYFNDQDGQRADDDTLGSGTWHNRRIPLDGLQGTTYSGIAFGGGTSADYNFQFASITVSSRDGSVHTIYDGTMDGPYVPVASDGNAVRFYVGDHLGSAQMEFSASGAPLSTSQFMPFGAEINPPVTTNHYKFTGLERDDELQQDHAQFRQLEYLQGRWTSPDPYDGSMDFSDPQSLNRYSYVGNNPLRFTDRSGLVKDLDAPKSSSCGTGCIVGAIAIVGLVIDEVETLFHHPSFHGSTTSRPGHIWDEHGGYKVHPFSLSGDLLGLGQEGCDFGACSGGFASGPLDPLEDHHLFSQEFREWFSNNYIAVDAYLIRMLRSNHRTGEGLHTNAGGNWNKVWREWITNNPNATKDEIWDHALHMIKSFGIGAGDVLGDFMIMVDPCSSAARQSRYFDSRLCGGPTG